MVKMAINRCSTPFQLMIEMNSSVIDSFTVCVFFWQLLELEAFFNHLDSWIDCYRNSTGLVMLTHHRSFLISSILWLSCCKVIRSSGDQVHIVDIQERHIFNHMYQKAKYLLCSKQPMMKAGIGVGPGLQYVLGTETIAGTVSGCGSVY